MDDHKKHLKKSIKPAYKKKSKYEEDLNSSDWILIQQRRQNQMQETTKALQRHRAAK